MRRFIMRVSSHDHGDKKCHGTHSASWGSRRTSGGMQLDSESLTTRNSNVWVQEKMDVPVQEEKENLPFRHCFVLFGLSLGERCLHMLVKADLYAVCWFKCWFLPEAPTQMLSEIMLYQLSVHFWPQACCHMKLMITSSMLALHSFPQC